MAQNLIRVDDEAYSSLSGMKTQGDTFNDVIHKLLEDDE